MAETKEMLKELKGGSSDVVIVGKVKLTEESFSGDMLSEKNKANPWAYRRLNFAIETEEKNTVFAQVSGGFHKKNPIVFTQDKDNNAVQIPWDKRHLKDVVETINPFKLFRGGLLKDGDKTKIESYAHAWDLYEYLEANLVQDMWVTARGKVEYQEYQGEIKYSLDIQSIYIYDGKKVKDEDGNEQIVKEGFTKLTQTLLLNEDSFKRITKDDKESGQVQISAFVPQYVSKQNGKELKKTIPMAMPIYVPISKDNPEQTEAILNKLFKVKKNTLRELTVECEIVEGFESSEPTQKDVSLSSEVQELIALGLYTEDEAKATASIRGNKIRKFVFKRPNLRKNKDNGQIILPMYDDKYELSALFAHVPDEDEEEGSASDHGIEVEGNDDIGGGDEDWMKSIGL